LASGTKFGLAFDQGIDVMRGAGGGHTSLERYQHECWHRECAAGLDGRDGCLPAAIGTKEPVVDQVQDLGCAERNGLEGQRRPRAQRTGVKRRGNTASPSRAARTAAS
jgi:hypothetical protein